MERKSGTGFIEELFSPRIIPVISMSIVVGILLVIFEVSFASMIFSGKLVGFASRAAGLILCGGFLMTLITAISSSFKGTVSLPQDAPVAVLASVAASIAAAAGPAATAEKTFMTVVAVMIVAAIFSGICFGIVGKFRLANLLRFMPYPVVGGFLAGTGWLLAAGSFGVMCDVSLTFHTLPSLIVPATLVKWIPGVIFGIVIFCLLIRWSHFLILPGGIVIGAAIFYGVLVVQGTTVEEAKISGFLISGVPKEGLWPVFSLSDLGLVDWQTVWQQMPAVFTVALVSIIGMLLNMSGIEFATRGELDMNKELMGAGLGNAVAGLCGAPPGYPSISLSLLGVRTGADSRLTGIISSLIVGAVLFFGGRVLEYFPKCLLGGLVLLLGLFFIYDWIIITRRRMPLIDWLIVVSIFLVIGFFGFLEGVAFGLVVTIIFFVFRFSRVPVVRQRFTALEKRSMKARSVPHRHILQAEAKRVSGYELAGYLFFGSASSLTDSLKQSLSTEPVPEYLLIDFSEVTGFDISVVNNFQRVAFSAKTAGAVLVFTAAPRHFIDAVKNNFPEDALARMMFFANLNDGIEWCEDQLIANVESALTREAGLRSDLFNRAVDDVMNHLVKQEYFETLMESLEKWLLQADHSAGTTIVEKSQEMEGCLFLTWGSGVALDPESGVKLGSLETGCVISAVAPFTDGYVSSSKIVADTDCRTAFFSRDARERLEKENTELALSVYKYLIRSRA